MDRVIIAGFGLFIAVSIEVAMYIALIIESEEAERMRRAIVRENDGNKWIFCPGCGKRIAVIRKGEKVDLPEVCPHCGNDIWYEEEENEH